jgi:hypothetical protein
LRVMDVSNSSLVLSKSTGESEDEKVSIKWESNQRNKQQQNASRHDPDASEVQYQNSGS